MDFNKSHEFYDHVTVKVTLAVLKKGLGDVVRLSADDSDARVQEPTPTWTAQMPKASFLAITWSPLTPVDIADFSQIEGWEHDRDLYV